MSVAVVADIEACFEELENSRLVKWLEWAELKTIVMIEAARAMAGKEIAEKHSPARHFFLTSLPLGLSPQVG